ncbi:MAG: ABC transporter substrate-binding protein [Chloroflexota bacterium]|nr:ABC transporter substrate-binding protein [Chloroflexota bacterium]
MSFAKRLVLVALIALFAFAAGVSAQESNILRVATNAPQNLDPAFSPNDPETLFNRTVYDYLVEVTPDNAIVPNLATEYTISDDGLVYTFIVQEGVTFHDGAAFTSADVVFTFDRLVEVGSPALNLLGSFTVEAPDATTVVFTLTQPNADFLYGVASRWSLILKDGTTEPNVFGEGDAALESFNGTGPFVLTAYEPGVRALFARNENYWQDGAPLLDGVEITFIDDPVAQVDALRGGAVDFIFKVPVDQISVLEGAGDLVISEVASSQHPVIRLRADQGAGTDVRVRQAFKLATDRAALNDILLQGRGVVGNNDPISPVFGAFFDDSIENAYDPEAARALLSEAGYADGLALTLYTPDSLGYADLAAVLQQQWAAAGINVEIVVRPENVYYSTDEWLTVDLGITGWGSRPTPQQVLVEAYASDGLYNESHWFDDELDALIVEAGTTADPAARAALYSQIAAIFAERGPVIVPYFTQIVGATRDTVQGIELAPFPGLTDFRGVSIGS